MSLVLMTLLNKNLIPAGYHKSVFPQLVVLTKEY